MEYELAKVAHKGVMFSIIFGFQPSVNSYPAEEESPTRPHPPTCFVMRDHIAHMKFNMSDLRTLIW